MNQHRKRYWHECGNHKEYARLLLSRAKIYRKMGKVKTALHLYRKAREMAPDNFKINFSLGEYLVLGLKNHWREALTCMNTCYRLEPEAPDINFLLSMIYKELDSKNT